MPAVASVVRSHHDWKSKCVQERSLVELWEAVLTSLPFLDISISHFFLRIYSSLPYHPDTLNFSIDFTMLGQVVVLSLCWRPASPTFGLIYRRIREGKRKSCFHLAGCRFLNVKIGMLFPDLTGSQIWLLPFLRSRDKTVTFVVWA